MSKKKLYPLLVESSEEALKKQNTDGSMPPGHNGPYHHPETPIRNTCHWIITFLKAYEITNDESFLQASERGIDFVIEQKGLSKYNYCHRTAGGKDKCNGLIGPAWTMESLLIASKELGRKDLADLAADIFFLHKFDEKRGLWHVREIDGEILSLDYTFNHQLWFAAIGSMFDKKEYPGVHEQVKVFIDRLVHNFNVYKNGSIKHIVPLVPWNIDILKRIGSEAAEYIVLGKKDAMLKAVGYHQFNLYAFGILKENYPGIAFWDSEKFKKALLYLESSEYEKSLEGNKYGFGYNVAGIEVAFILSIFKENSEDLVKYWTEKQFQKHYNADKKMLCENTDDPETVSARLYEATRLPDIEIDL